MNYCTACLLIVFKKIKATLQHINLPFYSLVLVLCLYGYQASADIKFIPNQGQWNTDAKFRAEIPGGYLYVFDNRLHYQFYQIDNYHANHNTITTGSAKRTGINTSSAFIQGLDVYFKNSLKPLIESGQETEEVFNYFYGQDQSKWAEGLHGFHELFLKNLYPGISLKIYFKDAHLKYDWYIEPGASASSIVLAYQGADSLKLVSGQLNIHVGINTIAEDRPIAFSEEATQKGTEVHCSYLLKDSLVSFYFPEGYDKDKKLIIDPKLIFSSYSGSFASNYGNCATYDADGNLYTGGTAYGNNFPVVTAVAGGFRQNLQGLSDIVLMKFSADGKRNLFSTYLGGNDGETPHSMIVNANNELIVMGSTSSRNFPVKNGYDNSYNGGQTMDPLGYIVTAYQSGSDIFLVKFSGTGNQLVAGTYLGGSNNDGVIYRESSLCKNYGDQFRGEVNLDTEGNILICSSTSSTDFPVNGDDKVYNNFTYDGVLIKLKPDLSGIIWSTYLGGNRDVAGLGVCVDKTGNIFVCGGININNGDAMLKKYSSDGVLLGTKIIGTSSYDQAYLIQSDSSDNIYILGQTKGSFPVSAGVYANKGSGQFIQKYDNNLNLQFSTVVGAGSVKYNGVVNPDISPTAFLVNECGMIYLAGWGGRLNSETDNDNNYMYIRGDTKGMPIKGSSTQAPYQSTTDGSDFYVMILDANAKGLLYATYFGGAGSPEHVDGGTSRFDKHGNIYECVCACFTRSGYPTTPGVVSNTNNTPVGRTDNIPDCNMAAFKFNLGYLSASFETFSQTNEGPGFDKGCAPLKLNITNTSQGGQSFDWTFADNTSFSGFSPVSHTYDSAGVYQISLIVKDDATCIKADTAVEIITVSDFKLSIIGENNICKDSSDLLTAIVVDSVNKAYAWSLNNTFLSSQSNILVKPAKESTYTITVKDTVKNCSKTESILVKTLDVKPEVISIIDADCQGKNTALFQNNIKDANSFQWNFGDGSSSSEASPSHAYLPGIYTVSLQMSNQLCKADTAFSIDVQSIFFPNLFTPNNDLKNDRFEIKGAVGNWKLQVYDRWGGEIVNYENYRDQWTGTNVVDGVYYFLLTSPLNRKCKGWVEIVR